MISPAQFYQWLKEGGVDFFCGVPDSLLKDICAYITNNTPQGNHIITANEGNAIALAAGHYMATGKIPLVYMQNSGIGNAINPLVSLADKQVYGIPMLLMIGWRGEPGTKDEPQHITQGEITLPLLEVLKIPYEIVDENTHEAKEQILKLIDQAKATSTPHALVVRKGVFEKYSLQSKTENSLELTREDALKIIVNSLAQTDIVISTTGKTSRELFEYRAALGHPHHSDFLTVGSMGHASQIALGIAIAKPHRKVICIDGDGALLMHMGALPIVGANAPENLIHIVINNGAHESVGGQPTVAFNMDIPLIAQAGGYKKSISVSTSQALADTLNRMDSSHCPMLIEVKVRPGSRDNLGRPTIKPMDNKIDFMKFLED